MIFEHSVLKHTCTHKGYTKVLLLHLKHLNLDVLYLKHLNSEIYLFLFLLSFSFSPFALNSSSKVFTQNCHIILDTELTVLWVWHPHCPGRAYTVRPLSTPNASSYILQNYTRNDREGKEGRKITLVNKSLGISRSHRNGDPAIKICFQVWHWGGMKYTQLSPSVGLCCTVKAASKLSCVGGTSPCQSPNNNKKSCSPLKLFLTREQCQQVLWRLLAEEVSACRQSGQQWSLCPAGCHSVPVNVESHGQNPHQTPGHSTL